jgi:hypothetical protein
MRTFSFMATAGTTAALALAVGLVMPSAASAGSLAKPLPCRASMSNSHPADYTTTTVRVTTASHAQVTTVAHYKTVNRQHHSRANGQGRASIPYYISGATPGFRVRVDVTVRWPHRTGSCQTSFTPHR